MSRVRLLTPWLLIASLLFGVWTAAGHDDHVAGASAHGDACVVCAFAGGLGGGLEAAVALRVQCAAAFAFAVATIPMPRAARCVTVRVRGPPSFLA